MPTHHCTNKAKNENPLLYSKVFITILINFSIWSLECKIIFGVFITAIFLQCSFSLVIWSCNFFINYFLFLQSCLEFYSSSHLIMCSLDVLCCLILGLRFFQSWHPPLTSWELKCEFKSNLLHKQNALSNFLEWLDIFYHNFFYLAIF